MSNWLPFALLGGVVALASSRRAAPEASTPQGANCLEELGRYLEGAARTGTDVDPDTVAGIIGGCGADSEAVQTARNLLARYAPALLANPYVAAAMSLLDPDTREELVEDVRGIVDPRVEGSTAEGIAEWLTGYEGSEATSVPEGPCLPNGIPARYYGRSQVSVDPAFAPVSLLDVAEYYTRSIAPRMVDIRDSWARACEASAKVRDIYCIAPEIDFGVVLWLPRSGRGPTWTVGWHGLDNARRGITQRVVAYNASPDDPPSRAACPEAVPDEPGAFYNQSMFTAYERTTSGTWKVGQFGDYPSREDMARARGRRNLRVGASPVASWAEREWGADRVFPMLGPELVAWAATERMETATRVRDSSGLDVAGPR